MSEAKKRFYVDVKGGTGYNIASIRVMQALKEKGYDFRVRSPYWDVFAAAGIDYYKPEQVRDFIFDAEAEDAEIVEHRLYDMDGFIKKKLNYRDAWTKLLGTPEISEQEYNHSLILDPVSVFPDLANQIKKVDDEIKGKNFIMVQFWGGQSPLGMDSSKPYSFENEPLQRHYPLQLAQKWVDLFKQRRPDVEIIQYSLPNEPQLNGCHHFVIPYLAYYELAKRKECLGAFCIDSSLQHLISGLTKVMVLWGHSLPDHFGYTCNNNIIQECRRDEILYFTELGASGAKINYIQPAVLVDDFVQYLSADPGVECNDESEAGKEEK